MYSFIPTLTMNPTLSFRPVFAADKELIYEWANDADTRQNSFQTAEISFEEHSNWFDAKLKDERASYFIVEHEGEAAAFVRFDKKETETVIGINLAKQFRGRGLAADCLKGSCKCYFEKHDSTVFAYIKESNPASIKSFEKAGFKFVSPIIINNFNAFKYKLQQHDLEY